jgi:LysM repeat protein
MKVSKVVLIVVALHVLVIGGIFIFEGCSRVKSPGADMAASDETNPADQVAANQTALPPAGAPDVSSLTPTAPTVPAVPTTATTVAPTVPVTHAAVTTATKTYAVKSGDSLWKIAKSENISLNDLAKANHITKTTTLKVGQKLTIPSVTKAEPATTAVASVIPTTQPTTGTALAPTATTPEVAGASYVVKSGDSLWKIARSQNSSVAAIKQANNLSSDSLKVGQKLAIPAATASAKATTPVASTSSTWAPGMVMENNKTYHVVDIGESPALIAKKYGVKTAELMKANNITSDRAMRVGDKLVIPTIPATVPATATAPAPAAAPTAATPPPAAPLALAPIVTAN